MSGGLVSFMVDLKTGYALVSDMANNFSSRLPFLDIARVGSASPITVILVYFSDTFRLHCRHYLPGGGFSVTMVRSRV